MEIEELCNTIISVYEETDVKRQDEILALQSIHKLRMKVESEGFSNDDLIPILTTYKKVASTKRKLKQTIEKEMLKWISYMPHLLWSKEDEEKKQQFERNPKTKEGQIAESLIEFAKEIFEIKLDRDAFSGKRRGFSIQLLESLSNYFEVPEFIEQCSKSIKSKSKNEFIESVECLQEYYIARDEMPSEDLIAIIDNRIEKTKHRKELVSALNLQIETGLIDELDALSRLEDWKEKNNQW